jgi:hypothetical protein
MKVFGPLMIAIILQFSLCLHELQWIMINVDDFFLPKNVKSPLETGLLNRVHLFFISRVLIDKI